MIVSRVAGQSDGCGLQAEGARRRLLLRADEASAQRIAK
jgi:hypothetical protein